MLWILVRNWVLFLIVSLSVLHYSFSETAHVNYVSKSYLSVTALADISDDGIGAYWLIDNSRDKDEDNLYDHLSWQQIHSN